MSTSQTNSDGFYRTTMFKRSTNKFDRKAPKDLLYAQRMDCAILSNRFLQKRNFQKRTRSFHKNRFDQVRIPWNVQILGGYACKGKYKLHASTFIPSSPNAQKFDNKKCKQMLTILKIAFAISLDTGGDGKKL